MEERRRSPRYPLELHATCFADNGKGATHIMLTEISEEGLAIKLLAEVELKTGRHFTIEIDVPDRVDPISVVVVLKRVEPLADEEGYDFTAGGELVSVTEADKQVLLEYGRQNRQRHSEE